MPKPDIVTKLFYVNWIVEQSDNAYDEVMFLISLIEDETMNHEWSNHNETINRYTEPQI